MPLFPLNIPPGLKRTGTIYQSKGRWLDAHLVRFFAGAVGPVGGWVTVKKTDGTDVSVTGVPRALLAWRTNDGRIWLAIGTNSNIYVYNTGTLTDITPGSGFTGGSGSSSGTGGKYGRGPYGRGAYGRGTSGSVLPGGGPLTVTEAGMWQLDSFGQLLIGVLSSDGKIRSWDLNVANDMTVIHASAPDALGVVTTPERFLLALGANKKATGTLTFTGQPANTETVTIDGKVYTFQTTLTAGDGNVLIGASTNASIDNLVAAINKDAGEGTVYGTGTVIHQTVSGVRSASTLVVTARSGGTGGNSIATTETIANASWGGAVLSGGYGSVRTIAWASQESLTDWTPSASNTAGDFDLETVGRLMAGKRTPRETLLWTDADLYSAIYIGGEFVYSFERRGANCGLIAPNAVALSDDGAVWMGNNGFFRYAGGVVPLECEVQDYVFNRINRAQARKIWCWSNSQFGEVWWFYPSTNSEEIDSYVVWNRIENHWTIGSLVRTAGVDRDPFVYPIATGADGKLYEHERGTIRSGTPVPFLESGPLELGDGDDLMMLRRLVPDEENLGDVTLTIKAAFHPTGTERTLGPYSLTEPTPLRVTGRQLRLRLEENVQTDWRVGTLRIDAVPAGKR